MLSWGFDDFGTKWIKGGILTGYQVRYVYFTFFTDWIYHFPIRGNHKSYRKAIYVKISLHSTRIPMVPLRIV